jgi:SAM-dependent methyltransferase
MMHNLLLKALNGVARVRRKDSVWVSLTASRLMRKMDELVGGTAEDLLTLRARSRLPRVIDAAGADVLSTSDRYWRRHTVRGKTFLSRQASLDYIVELTDGRPLKRELLKLHGPHKGKVIMDYGCGPGNDLAGFAEYSEATKIIGVDISPKALQLARSRVSWHVRDPSQLSFIRVADEDVRLPLIDCGIDYIQSLGVIHHATNPNRIFCEFHRLLKPDGQVRIMLYNADSLHIQLEIGYVWRLVNGMRGEASPEALFTSTADLGAPIAHCVRPGDVAAWIDGVGFDVEFVGGFFVPGETTEWEKKRDLALADHRVSGRQREFLESLERHSDGLPYYLGKPAGLGGVYVLTKRN